MTALALSGLLLASLLWGGWQWYGKRRAQAKSDYNLSRFRHWRKQYRILSQAHERNEEIFRQMRRITNQPSR